MSRSAAVDAYLRTIRTAECDRRDAESAFAAGSGDGAGTDEARRTLASAHLRFVVSIATRYRKLGLPLEDLVSEGNVGLMQAAYLYDPAHGTRFVTYAVYWIRRAILRALAAHRTLVHVPSNRRRRARSVREAERGLRDELRRAPTAEEVRQRTGLTRRQVEDLQGIDSAVLSLAAPASPELDLPMSDLLPAAETSDPHDSLRRRDAAERVRCALTQLPDRSRLVIESRYGLDGGDPASLRDLAGQLGVTAEAVRLMEARALVGLRRAVVACGRRHGRVHGPERTRHPSPSSPNRAVDGLRRERGRTSHASRG